MAAGRGLGPAQYGNVHLAIAVSDILALIATLGIPATLVKRLADSPEPEKQGEAVSAAFTLFGLLSAALWLLVCLLGHFAAAGLRMPAGLVFWAMLRSSTLGLFILCGSVLVGHSDFKNRGLAEALYQVAALALALAFLAARPSYGSVMLALSLAFILGALFCIRAWPRLALAPPSAASCRPLLEYGQLATLWTVSSVLILATGRLLLNYFHTGDEVGLFGAYYTGTVMVAMALCGILSTVLFPAACGDEAQAWAWAMLRRAAPWALALCLPAFLASGALFLALFGPAYPVRWDWLALFSAGAALFAAKELLGQVLAARDSDGVRIAMQGGFLTAAVQLVVGLLAIPRWGLAGAGAALGAGLLCGVLYYGRGIARLGLWSGHAPLA